MFRWFSFLSFFVPVILNASGAANDIKSKKAAYSHVSTINSQQLLDVVDAQLKAIRAKDIDKAYDQYTSAEFRKKTSLDDFKKLIDKFKALSNNKLFQFQSFYLEDDIATFSGDLHSMEGESIPVEYDFVLEDGKWKILGIQIYQTEMALPFQEER